MRKENLLVELGTEELPPKALKNLAQAFADNIKLGFEATDLEFDAIESFATPRRLAVRVIALAEKQLDKQVEKRGPAVTAAFDAQGNPTKAAEGWARSNGISVDQAQRLKTDKGEWLLHVANVAGQTLTTLLEEIVESALKKLPIPKAMRWGNKGIQFIRPVHTLCMLYGESIVAGSVLGLTSTRTVNGHRFHGETSFELAHADDYQSQLKNHYVIADYQARQDIIKQQLQDAAAQENGVVELEQELLDEVTALVEWPVVLVANFEDEFLQVPKEALIYTMKGDQKYFPMLDTNGELKSRFLFVTNIESKDPAQVIHGNEKVIRPRLADARFFFETDKKRTLESRLDSLETVLFQKQLGTLADKSRRISKLAAKISKHIGADEAQAARAGLLSKTDLMTEMVMEFPDVQGIMGMHYANHDGEDAVVANALNEQYMPRFSGDALPQSNVSCAVALADKLDTLVGIFGIGQLPKGDKDPFALRRAAIGILRIAVELKLPVDLTVLVSDAYQLLQDKINNNDTEEQVVDFILGRFRTWYQEQGIEVDVIQAVLSRRPTAPADFDARIHGVKQFKLLPSAQALAAANKRVANILDKNNVSDEYKLDASLLVESEEKHLADEIYRIQEEVAPLLAKADYEAVLQVLSQLASSIDAFFDNVMVMADDQSVKNNRLALLLQLRQLFLKCADISLLRYE
ncbi:MULTISPECIES: glycine--tRNA ligase subunit beta [Aliiglaciecola]|uniref:glycine--tRNA ligase subunit beta n=1 Tax=Aliiglaciecola TaxID=1406885 RepID=UPI001C087942|nr:MULTISPECIES: glycine--tRNA ligase subunit beta [Aliiglaciecola]MBU2876489.1 glycine--tRNA ligase subunit beta [Aliiglaciecola lipolytica]MDO6713047.1 glycine--tRNA ligase subunit beta [Aliiglaciecola sp. 2_MG-2023]MDO6754086.1 glycine--tRNA ligase subunit beta [Aliiglaciecola sp. 1_MG-2023]